jgi:CheY-like chemotaxis protein
VHTEYLQKLKILVAEDSLVNKKLLEMLFQQHHLHADFVENGQQVLKKLGVKKNAYHLILMDLHMPQMDGYNATVYIRNMMQNNVPIIAMSGFVSEAEMNKTKEVGMNDYISKPVDMQLLFEKIYTLTQKEPAVVAPIDAVEQKKYQFVDLTYLNSLSQGNPSFKIKILEIFLEDLPPQLAAVALAIQQSNFDEAVAIVHKMKSSVKMLGLEQAAELLTQLELDLMNGLHKDTCAERIQKVDTILKGAFVELEAIVTKLRAL